MNLNRQCVFSFIASIWFVFLSGCATTHPSDFSSAKTDQSDLLSSILEYEHSLDESDPDRIKNLLKISPDIKQWVKTNFTQQNKHERATALVDWMRAETGLGLEYNLEANLTPQEILKNRQGNCLSFTLLLVTLAKELNLDLQYNDVDIPVEWGQNENNLYVFYRHINAIYKSPSQYQIFDLTIDDYDPAFPQRIVSKRAAVAMFHANLGINALKAKDYERALHHTKLSVSMDPDNSFSWINLGVVLKRSGDLVLAEQIFKTALKINDNRNLASSNLERLYRKQGRHDLADTFKKRAEVARENNPYFQFSRAKYQYKQKNYKAARKHINRAIQRHNLDPNFFELRSRIHQHLKKYRLALTDIETASNLSNNLKQRQRYFKKGQLLTLKARIKHQKSRERRQRIFSIDNKIYL